MYMYVGVTWYVALIFVGSILILSTGYLLADTTLYVVLFYVESFSPIQTTNGEEIVRSVCVSTSNGK